MLNAEDIRESELNMVGPLPKSDKDNAPTDVPKANNSPMAVDNEEKEEKSSCRDEVGKEASLPEGVETVQLIVTYKGEKITIVAPVTWTLGDVKTKLADETGIPATLQKLTSKYSFKSDKVTLQSLNVVSGTKILLIGSKPEQISEALANPKKVKVVKADTSSRRPLSSGSICYQEMHKKILDRGVPEDAMIGILNCHDPLPHSITGMVNRLNKKVRLSFKLESDELWISTKERTEKVSMSRIKNVACYPIENHEEYSIVGLQLGQTEASYYWIYWLPAQFTDALKKAILGP